MIITIEDTVGFAPNIGILILKPVAEVSPDRLHNLILSAEMHMQDDLLVDCCCGGSGPLAEIDRQGTHKMDFDDYIRFTIGHHQDALARIAKRIEFNRARPAIFNQMIEAGINPICAEAGCYETNDLTIDHIQPIYRGGSNDLSNLQFLCRSHNSKKGAK